MNDTEKKLLRNARVQTCALLCILALVVGTVVFMATQLSSLRTGMELLDADLQTLDMQEVEEAIHSLKDAAEKLSEVDMSQLNETAGSLQDAAAKLADVDTDSLNRTVTALKGAAENLKEVDVEALNGLIEALQTSAEKLQNAVNAITGIFKR